MNDLLLNQSKLVDIGQVCSDSYISLGTEIDSRTGSESTNSIQHESYNCPPKLTSYLEKGIPFDKSEKREQMASNRLSSNCFRSTVCFLPATSCLENEQEPTTSLGFVPAFVNNSTQPISFQLSSLLGDQNVKANNNSLSQIKLGDLKEKTTPALEHGESRFKNVSMSLLSRTSNFHYNDDFIGAILSINSDVDDFSMSYTKTSIESETKTVTDKTTTDLYSKQKSLQDSDFGNIVSAGNKNETPCTNLNTSLHLDPQMLNLDDQLYIENFDKSKMLDSYLKGTKFSSSDITLELKSQELVKEITDFNYNNDEVKNSNSKNTILVKGEQAKNHSNKCLDMKKGVQTNINDSNKQVYKQRKGESHDELPQKGSADLEIKRCDHSSKKSIKTTGFDCDPIKTCDETFIEFSKALSGKMESLSSEVNHESNIKVENYVANDDTGKSVMKTSKSVEAIDIKESSESTLTSLSNINKITPKVASVASVVKRRMSTRNAKNKKAKVSVTDTVTKSTPTTKSNEATLLVTFSCDQANETKSAPTRLVTERFTTPNTSKDAVTLRTVDKTNIAETKSVTLVKTEKEVSIPESGRNSIVVESDISTRKIKKAIKRKHRKSLSKNVQVKEKDMIKFVLDRWKIEHFASTDVNLTLSSYVRCNCSSDFRGRLEGLQASIFTPADFGRKRPLLQDRFTEKQILKKRRLSSDIQMQYDIFRFSDPYVEQLNEIWNSMQNINQKLISDLSRQMNIELNGERSRHFSRSDNLLTLQEHEIWNISLKFPRSPYYQVRNLLSREHSVQQHSLDDLHSMNIRMIRNRYFNQQQNLMEHHNVCIDQVTRATNYGLNSSINLQVPLPKGPSRKNGYTLTYEKVTLPLMVAAAILKEERIYEFYYCHPSV